MTELEEEILKEIALKPYLWWGYIDETFFFGNTEKMLDVTVSLIGEKVTTDLYVKLTDSRQ